MSGVSRRDLFRSLLGRGRAADAPPAAAEAPAVPSKTEAQFALILDRFCLAYQGGFCSICSEHCPEAGAIVVTQGKPQVIADLCTGCQKCHEACPAPKKAIFLVAKQARPGMVSRPIDQPSEQARDHG